VALQGVVFLMAACTSGSPGDSKGSTPPAATSTPAAPPAMVSLGTAGGDVFAWNQVVDIRTAVDCTSVAISSNGRDSGAKVEGQGRSFKATVPIAPGDNELVASCVAADGTSKASQPVVFVGRLQERPTARIEVTVKDRTVTLDGSGSEPSKGHGAKIDSYTWSSAPGERNPGPLVYSTGRPFTGSVIGPTGIGLGTPKKDGEYYVTLTVTDAQGRTDAATTYFVVEKGVPRAVDMALEHPAWIDTAIIYAPIPDLTEEGGPLGVEKQLPYLKGLGVDTLWLWPPAEERAVGEQYAITDYFKIDPQWGTEEEFKQMVDAAHRLGMHVLVDYVVNHTSDQAPYFKDALALGTASHYYDFYDRNAEGTPTHYFDWTNLPNLNYDNPQVRSMIIEASLHWVRDLGIDGFRMDAAWGVKRRRPDFWPEWRAAIKRVKPNVLLLAEASATDPYYFTHGFDMGYDWTDQPGQWAWTSVFDFPQEAGALLEPAVTNGGKGFSDRAIVMHFLNNNDTGIRFVDQYGVGLTKVAATLQFMLPGVPEMFAGDEIGASYEPYSNLTPITWDDKRHHLRGFYKTLISLKRSMPTLASHQVESLTPDPSSAYAFVRPGFGGGPPVLVILNFGGKAKVVIGRTAGVQSVVGSGKVKDLLTGKDRTLPTTGGSLTISMGAESALAFEPVGGL
jgi:cyclomaltodextrinase / maltogenic alpha-amylase / neopullulanase